MEKNPVIEYLWKEIQVIESRLKQSKDKYNQLQENIREDSVRLRTLNETFDKALSDLDIDPKQYKLKRKNDFQSYLKANEFQGTLADAAYTVLSYFRQPMHITEIVDIIVSERMVKTTAEDPVASITSAIVRDKEKFHSLGKGKWEIRSGNLTNKIKELLQDPEKDTKEIVDDILQE